jgi:hypothetical protein
MKSKNIKFIAGSSLLLVIGLAIAGCGNRSSTDTNNVQAVNGAGVDEAAVDNNSSVGVGTTAP